MSKIHSYRLSLIALLFVVALIPVAFAEQTINDRVEIDDISDISAGDMFGYHIENIGDLDSDGVVDLAVVSFRDDVPSLEADIGSILILFMNSDGSVKSTNKINIDDTANGLGGSNPGNQNCIAGDGTHTNPTGLEQIAFVGDLDGDGKPTLAIGMPENSHDGKTSTGAIYMVELLSTGKVDTCLRIVSTGDGTGDGGFNPTASVYNVGGNAEEFEAELGRVLLATDVNGDGQNELIVGAETVETRATSDDLWVMFLTSTGAVDSFVQISTSSMGSLNASLNDGTTFGGGNKFVVGSVNEGENEEGSIFIITVATSGAFSSFTEITGESLGVGDEKNFGRGIADLGDLDGDGIDDIMVGNIIGDGGEVFILFLNSDDTVKESQKISNESEDARNGTTPFASGDQFGNGMTLWTEIGGKAIIAIGAHRDDTGGDNSGAIHLFYITDSDKSGSGSAIVSGGGCNDCVPPTIEITQNQNTVTISAWEEKGPYYIQLTELSLDTATIQVWMDYWLYQDIPNVKEIKTIDPDGILESSDVVVSTVDCDKKIECLQVHFLYDLTNKVSDISFTTSDFYKNSVTEILDSNNGES